MEKKYRHIKEKNFERQKNGKNLKNGQKWRKKQKMEKNLKIFRKSRLNGIYIFFPFFANFLKK